MKKINWDQTFSVGVDKLDNQHKQITELINTLVDEYELHGTIKINSELISSILTKLQYYAGEHFQLEEELMLRHNYPGYSSQKTQHREFRIQVAQFCLDVMENKLGTSESLLEFIMNWWETHILKYDMQYRPYLSETPSE